MKVHMVGVCGTGMGSLASLFRRSGHVVSGSDVRFDPPMGDVLRASEVVCLEGWDAAHVSSGLDLVVVGNVVRKGNPEAEAALARGIPCASMSQALRDNFLVKRRPLVVAGTHGKTTTASMCAWALREAGFEPGYFIGGVSKSLPESAAIGRKGPALTGPPAPFVVEGDEYDAVYWNKQPKLLDYVGVGADDVAVLTSVEHDHMDIYPTESAYVAAFESFCRKMPSGGLLLCHAADERAVRVSRTASCRVAYYGLQGDTEHGATPTWLAAPARVDDLGRQPFDLFAGGVSCGRFTLGVPGLHNVRNAVAVVAACAEGFGVAVSALRASLASFAGVKRRQDLLGTPGGVRVYDDFAHHPTAVDETLRALRSRHPDGGLIAVFEPRSATACRKAHQDAYAGAFGAATRVILAPLGRANLDPAEALDLSRLAEDLGPKATVAGTLDAIPELLAREARPGDTVALLSNGAMGGLPTRVLAVLAPR